MREQPCSIVVRNLNSSMKKTGSTRVIDGLNQTDINMIKRVLLELSVGNTSTENPGKDGLLSRVDQAAAHTHGSRSKDTPNSSPASKSQPLLKTVKELKIKKWTQ